jgi:hypothetical protein
MVYCHEPVETADNPFLGRFLQHQRCACRILLFLGVTNTVVSVRMFSLCARVRMLHTHAAYVMIAYAAHEL